MSLCFRLRDEFDDKSELYKINFEVKPEDWKPEEEYEEENIISANITVEFKEEVTETFVPVNNTEPEEETFDFDAGFKLVEHLFIMDEPITSPEQIAFLRDTFPYPIPYITEIDSDGGMKIKFSRQLAIGGMLGNSTKQEHGKFVERNLIGKSAFLLTLVSTQDEDDSIEEVVQTQGDAYFDKKRFEDIPSKRRRLQDVEEEAELVEEQIQRSFNWTIVDFNGDELNMKFNYNDLLTKNRVHRLQLVYNETAFLKGLDSTLVVPAGFKQRVKVPK